MGQFQRYIGIDYSGAGTADSSQPGLRVYVAEGHEPPREQLPPPSPRKYWTRRALADWVRQRLMEPVPTIVGIDHAFSFPQEYFQKHELPPSWEAFLADFGQHWPTTEPSVTVESVRKGRIGTGTLRTGQTRWRRVTEQWAGGAKSVFHFGVPGQVAPSTHAGLPWLAWWREQLGSRVHFWPFDGWQPAAGRHVIAEVYPSLWSGQYDADPQRTADQQDAWVVCAELQRADRQDRLRRWFGCALAPVVRQQAAFEGWILGVTAESQRKPRWRARREQIGLAGEMISPEPPHWGAEPAAGSALDGSARDDVPRSGGACAKVGPWPGCGGDAMNKTYQIELEAMELGQVLDALEMRAEAWERTAQYHRNPEDSWRLTGDIGGVVEESSGVAEAERMAASYRAIISKIRAQMRPGDGRRQTEDG